MACTVSTNSVIFSRYVALLLQDLVAKLAFGLLFQETRRIATL